MYFQGQILSPFTNIVVLRFFLSYVLYNLLHYFQYYKRKDFLSKKGLLYKL